MSNRPPVQSLSIIRCLVLTGLLSLQNALAGELATRCLDGGSNVLIPIHDDMPEAGFSGSAAVPQIVTAKDEKITWTKNAGEVKTTTTMIGRYRDHVITEIIYNSPKDAAEDSTEAPFSFVVFFYTTIQKSAVHIRPFFILSGDDVRWFDYYFRSTKTEPFALVIENTSPGNGIYTTEWDFSFSDRQALITHRSEGGRQAPTKDYDYSPLGKIIKVTTTGGN